MDLLDRPHRSLLNGWDLPLCAVCQRPVEELWWIDDPMKLGRTLAVRCHGEVEMVYLTLNELVEMAGPDSRFHLGEAFKVPRHKLGP